MFENDSNIHHVSDTALWVAYYRAQETKRSDGLFKDVLAERLVGSRGKEIAEKMKATARYTEWSVVIRTCIIDSYIKNSVANGIDTVINLGAGLDTRPYRMDLPSSLNWIELDYAQIIDHKNKLLQDEKTNVKLKRIAIDLGEEEQRKKLFEELAKHTKKALILTEGVIPYLTETQVSSLAQALHLHDSFKYWITEFFAPHVYRYLNNPKRKEAMKKSPFQFFPGDWFGFFHQNGWVKKEICYLTEESIKLARTVPMPWWAYLFRPFLSRKNQIKYRQQMGYVVFEKG